MWNSRTFRASTETITIASSEPVTLEFVKGVTRLNTRRYRDYYFSCNINGRFLQWQYNNNLLTGFREVDEVGRPVVFTRPSYSYTASLLSSERLRNHRRAMDSILMITFTGPIPSDFNITCSNGPNSKKNFQVQTVSQSSTSLTLKNNTEYYINISCPNTSYIYKFGKYCSIVII